MTKITGCILKADSVKIQGQLRLDMKDLGRSQPKEKTAVSVTPKARILETHPEFAVVEITCSCGKIMHVKCEYANAEPSPEPNSEQTK